MPDIWNGKRCSVLHRVGDRRNLALHVRVDRNRRITGERNRYQLQYDLLYKG